MFTHLYTLIVKDGKYEVKIDNAKVESGVLEEDWDFLLPKKIKVRLQCKCSKLSTCIFLVHIY